MSRSLSLSQRYVLQELVRRGGSLSRGNTNPTLNALERKGLVTSTQTPKSRLMLEFVWSITDAGRAAL